MVIDAGRLCNITRFDWVKDELTPSQFVKILPMIYHTWSLSFPDNIDKVEKAISLELEVMLETGKWKIEDFLTSISREGQKLDVTNNEKAELKCSVCHDDYSALGIGVVSPAWVAFLECTKTNHKLHCTCSSYLVKSGILPSPPPYISTSDYISPFTEDSEDEAAEEEFISIPIIDISPLCVDFIASRSHLTELYDPFMEAATLLYRAQGRTWLNAYAAVEKFCATCFLLSEEYIRVNGLGTEGKFSEMPESFVMWRVGEGVCSFDKE